MRAGWRLHRQCGRGEGSSAALPDRVRAGELARPACRVSHTLRSEALPQASDARDFILLASLGYFRPVGDESEIGFETGFRVKSDGNDRSNTLALRLSYRLEF